MSAGPRALSAVATPSIGWNLAGTRAVRPVLGFTRGVSMIEARPDTVSDCRRAEVGRLSDSYQSENPGGSASWGLSWRKAVAARRVRAQS